MAGSAAAWEEFVDRWGEYIYSIIQQSLRSSNWAYSQEDAEDILSQVFISFLDNQKQLLRNFKWRCSLKTWIWIVTRKTVIRYFRKKRWKTVPIVEAAEEDSEDQEGMIAPDRNPGPLEQAEQKEKEEILKEIIDQLPERDRLALTFYFYDEASHAEIAEILGIKPHYVGTIIFRAKKLLEGKIAGKIKKNE